MLDQLLGGLKGDAISKLTQGAQIDAGQAAAALPLAGDSVKEGLMSAVTGGNLSGVTSLLGAASGGGGGGMMQNMVYQGIATNFISKATSSLGLSSGIAGTVASTVLPMILSKIGGAAKANGPNDDISAANVMSVLGGGGGLMDQAKGMLGGLMG